MTLNLVHGYRMTTNDDAYVVAIEHVSYLAVKYTPGAVPVDFLPICTSPSRKAIETNLHIVTVRFLPERFPGAGFVRHAKETDVVVHELCDELYGYVKKQRVSRNYSHSSI